MTLQELLILLGKLYIVGMMLFVFYSLLVVITTPREKRKIRLNIVTVCCLVGISVFWWIWLYLDFTKKLDQLRMVIYLARYNAFTKGG